MQGITGDPIIRYGALGLVACSFLGFLAVAVHGFWVDPTYQLPPFVAGILGPVLGALIGLVGAHYGASTNSSGVTQGAAVIKNGAATVSTLAAAEMNLQAAAQGGTHD